MVTDEELAESRRILKKMEQTEMSNGTFNPYNTVHVHIEQVSKVIRKILRNHIERVRPLTKESLMACFVEVEE